MRTHTFALRLRGDRWIRSITVSVWRLVIWPNTLWSTMHSHKPIPAHTHMSLWTLYCTQCLHLTILIFDPPAGNVFLQWPLTGGEGCKVTAAPAPFSHTKISLVAHTHTHTDIPQMQGLTRLTSHITAHITHWHAPAGPVSVTLHLWGLMQTSDFLTPPWENLILRESCALQSWPNCPKAWTVETVADIQVCQVRNSNPALFINASASVTISYHQTRTFNLLRI